MKSRISTLRKFAVLPALFTLVLGLTAVLRAEDAPLQPSVPPLRDVLKAIPFRVAYESYVNGTSDIFVMNADGANPTRLTSQPPGECAHYPQVSPDGTKIAYTVDKGEDRETVRSLWVMDSDGKNQKKIADQAREPFWAPDGKVIGYLPQEFPKFNVIDFSTKGMMFYHLDTGATEPHPNSENFRHLYHPRFSPNGKWIVATVHGGMGVSHAILALEAHGNKIINTGLPGCRPTISPDGQHIAWGSSDHELNTAAFDTDSDDPKPGPREMHIKDAKNKVYHIAWSPDSKYVSFSRGPDGEGDLTKAGTYQAACEIIGVYATNWNLFAVSAEHPRVIDLNAAGDAEVVQLTSDGCSNKEPAWYTPASAPAPATAAP